LPRRDFAAAPRRDDVLVFVRFAVVPLLPRRVLLLPPLFVLFVLLRFLLLLLELERAERPPPRPGFLPPDRTRCRLPPVDLTLALDFRDFRLLCEPEPPEPPRPLVPSASFTVVVIGLPVAIDLPASAPTIPPTTAPMGPATLPSTAPVAAPAADFGIGGISMFSFDCCSLDCAFSFCSSGISG